MKVTSMRKLPLQEASALCMLYLLVSFVDLGVAQDGTPYQPECQSLDEVISEVQRNIAEYGGSVDCTKFEDCTGVQCQVDLLGKTIETDVKLFPCDDPPQMRLLVTGGGANFEQTVTQDSSYVIPGLTYSPLPFTRVNVQMIVQFEPHDDGIVIGLDIKPVGLPGRYTLFHDVLIQTPPCTDVDAHTQDCAAMQLLTESVPPPKSCATNINCDGTDCTETLYHQIGSITIPIRVDTSLVVDSCSSPISLILSAKSQTINLDWKQAFNQSDSVHVDQDLSYDIDVVVHVSMEPQSDLEHILTTITYTISLSGEEDTDTFLTDALVPIPECREQPDQPRGPTETPPAKDECESWQRIEDSLMFSAGEYSVDECDTLPGCRGFNCSATYQDQIYQVVIEEFHCQDPTYVMVSVDGPGEHFANNYTHNETTLLPGSDDAYLVVHLVEESPTTIFVGAYVVIPVPDTGPVRIPLIEDQLLEVTSCDASITIAMETAGVSEGGGVMQASSVTPSDVKPTTSSGGMNADSVSDSSGDKGSNKPLIQPVNENKGIGMGWTILLGITAASVFALVVIIFALFMRQRRMSADLDILMESTDENRDSYVPWNT